MKKWLSMLKVKLGRRPELSDKEAAEEALRVFPRCC